MTSTSENLTPLYLHGSVQLLALVIAAVGVVTWIAGWRYGHGVVTLCLLVVIVVEYGGLRLRRGLGAAYAVETRKNIRASDPEEAVKAAGTALRHFRKVAAKQPADGWRVGQIGTIVVT